MAQRAVAAAVAAAVLLVSAVLAGCTGGSGTPSVAPTAFPKAGADDTLREFVPDGFQLGVAVVAPGRYSPGGGDPLADNEQYRDTVATEFTSLTPENQLKWEYVHPAQDTYFFDDADALFDFAEAHGQVVRGHTLLWHSQNPSWLESGNFTPDQLRAILHDHITTVVGRYAGRVAQWDVANEIFDDSGKLRTEDNIWLRELGPGIIADAFRWAHEADPDALLFLNDYSAESIGAKSDAYLALATQLLAEGVPLDGFAVQGHLSLEYPAPTDLQANLQRFADLGLHTAVTELDVRMKLDGEPTADQLAEQARYYRLVLDSCLAVDGCDSVTLWGIPDNFSWVPFFFPDEGAATPFWDDFTRKAAYCELQEGLAEASDKASEPAFTSRGCAASG